MKVKNIWGTLVMFVQYQGRKAGTGQVLLSLFDSRRQEQILIQSSMAWEVPLDLPWSELSSQ